MGGKHSTSERDPMVPSNMKKETLGGLKKKAGQREATNTKFPVGKTPRSGKTSGGYLRRTSQGISGG